MCVGLHLKIKCRYTIHTSSLQYIYFPDLSITAYIGVALSDNVLFTVTIEHQHMPFQTLFNKFLGLSATHIISLIFFLNVIVIPGWF